MGEITVIVEQPFDWVVSVLIPVSAVLVSSAIALFVAGMQTRADQRARVRGQVAELIRALYAFGMAVAIDAPANEWNAAALRYATELNALAAMLPPKDIAVPRFISEVLERANESEIGSDRLRRVTLWASTALELWARGVLKSRQFRDNMPPRRHWVDAVDLGQWDPLLRGAPVMGVYDLPDSGS